MERQGSCNRYDAQGPVDDDDDDEPGDLQESLSDDEDDSDDDVVIIAIVATHIFVLTKTQKNM